MNSRRFQAGSGSAAEPDGNGNGFLERDIGC
jgi:hypothetical protein